MQASRTQRSRLRRRCDGLTLIDVMITTAVLAIIVASAVPITRTNSRTVLLSAARMIIGEIEHAQIRSITEPEKATAVTLGESGTTFWLAAAATPATPLDLTEGTVLESGSNGGVFSFPDGIAASLGGDTSSLAFDQYGRLTTADNAVITLTYEDQQIVITVNALTGSITTD
jgi:Tfp pilus assembly protein FimT